MVSIANGSLGVGLNLPCHTLHDVSACCLASAATGWCLAATASSRHSREGDTLSDGVCAVQQYHLDDGGDGDGIDRMAGRKGRAGKTQHGVVHRVVHVERVFEPGLSARQPSDALGIGHVDGKTQRKNVCRLTTIYYRFSSATFRRLLL